MFSSCLLGVVLLLLSNNVPDGFLFCHYFSKIMKSKFVIIICVVSSLFFCGGLKLVLCLLFVPTFIIASIIGFLCESQASFSFDSWDNFGPYKTLKKLSLLKSNIGNPRICLDKRVSGSSVIDDALQELLNFIMRDYIENWFSIISKETEFPMESRQFFQKIAINISSRCKEVDWLPFLTTRFVDSVIAHIRLHREAKLKLKQKFQNMEESSVAIDHNLLTIFFELEVLGSKKVCRKRISMDSVCEKESLKLLSDFLLQLLGTREEFNCRPAQLLSSQILAGEIIIPLLDQLSDPDYINQTLIWLCKSSQIASDSFLAVLRVTENLNELEASRELVTREIAIMRSHDFGGEGDVFIKRRLSSLLFVYQLIESHIQEIKDGGITSNSLVSTQSYWNRYMTEHGHSVYQLPLDVCLKNSVALSYFLDFMANIGFQAYIFFLLNVEGWKIAAGEQVLQLKKNGINIKQEYDNVKKSNLKALESNSPGQMLLSLQESATSIYKQYFSDDATARLQVGDVIVRRLLYNLVNEAPAESWFDEATSAVVSKLEKDDRFLPTFRKSVGYIRMLAELDMLKDVSKCDDDDPRLFDDQKMNETSPILLMDFDEKGKHLSGHDHLSVSGHSSEDPSTSCYSLRASINQKGIVKDGMSSHTVYAVTVVKLIGEREIDSWVVYRRYSDFYDFHFRLEEKFKGMKELSFPAKRAFNNMSKLFQERRQYLLNEYLTKLFHPEFLRMNAGLLESLRQFFDRGSYEHSKGSISRKVDILVNPLVSSMRTVTKVVRMESAGLLKESSNESYLNESTGMSIYGDDQLPLRILLILMDEVFDLQNRNQWLRKRVFYMLREILRAMFGDVFNQKIVDFVDTATSPEQVAEFIHLIKDTCWPNGVPAMPRPTRDEATRMRTRVAAKMSLISRFPDEIKHLIGSETAREGVLRLFELFQNPVLNRRLLYVIFEGVIDTLFPDSNVDEFFENLYSGSSNSPS